MDPIRSRMNVGDWGLLLFLSLLWGGSFFFNQVAVAELPVLTVVAGRVALAAVALWMVAALLGTPLPRSRAVLVAFLGMGFLNNAVPFTLIVWGQAQIGSGVAAILNAATPLFAVVVAGRLTADEPLTVSRLVGATIGFAGVAVLVGASPSGGALAAKLACVAAGLSYAFGGVWGRRFRVLGVSPLVTAAGQVTTSSVLLVPLALALDRPWTLPVPSPEALASLAAVALLSTALAYVVYFGLLARAGATNLLLVTLLIPVTALLLGVGVLGEVLLPRHAAGMALIATGLAVIDGRPLARLRGA
jgi:drug/metabolite transporter (DMT)-like permease